MKNFPLNELDDSFYCCWRKSTAHVFPNKSSMEGEPRWTMYCIISKLWPPQCKTAIFAEESRVVSMCVHEHAYKTHILELCGFGITTADLLHLLHRCLEHCSVASGPHLDVWAVWTSTKASSTRATDNMAMLKADDSKSPSSRTCHWTMQRLKQYSILCLRKQCLWGWFTACVRALLYVLCSPGEDICCIWSDVICLTNKGFKRVQRDRETTVRWEKEWRANICRWETQETDTRD